MAFGYQPYQTPMYQPYQSPMYQPMDTMRAAPDPAPGGITWVQGEAGAKSYMVPRGGSALLMDSENPYLYLKATDASGMPQQLRKFRLVEETAAAQAPAIDPQYVTRDELEKRLAELRKKEDADA